MVGGLLERATFPFPGDSVVCAVSGGADSLALMALAVASGCRVTAVHVDHGIRPGSAAEAAVVARAAELLGASFQAERVEVRDGPGLEARARAARFGVLPADAATGHTMDDQAETVLCNLLRGAGLEGVAGMRAGPCHPLLALRRRETAALCAALGLEPVSDPSNDDPRHLRNRIRHRLLPLIAELSGRDPVPLLARHALLAREDADLLEALVGAAVPDPGDARAVAALPTALSRRALRTWLRDSGATLPAGGRRGPGAHHPPSLAEVGRVLEVARGAAVATELSGAGRVWRSGGRLYAGRGPKTRPGHE
jgi:tRNA(Ile)-lysidine synthase